MTSISEILDDKLTPAQRAAATDTAAEVRCLACAGSGKSQTLAYRVAWLLDQGADPRSIVAFTFTDKAADSIKLRVAQALEATGKPPTVLGAMYIGTIHAYCQNLLSAMDARHRQFDVLDDNGLILYLVSRYPQLEVMPLRSAWGSSRGRAPYFRTIKAVAEAWKTANEEMLRLEDIVAADPQLGQALVNLQHGLDRDHFLDFSLMVRLAVEALQQNHPGALEAVSRLEHLMVDEYQDVNTVQETLIRELRQRSRTLFVVGDDDQAIYAWRGADVDNIISFDQRYPDSSAHTLPHNFRSTRAIVESADAFAQQELGAKRIPKTPTADDPEGPRDLRVLWFDTREAESDWVASRIENLISTSYIERNGETRGLTPGDFAVLMNSVRSRSNGITRHQAFTDALTARGIPFTLDAGGGLFDRPQVEVLRTTFELLGEGSPDRPTALAHFNDAVVPLFPHADFGQFAAVLADWGRRIHAPMGGVRQRLYPQALVHELLDAFGVRKADLPEEVMLDLGMFSRIMQDVESVYMSVDSQQRFVEVLRFLRHVADTGYSAGTDEVLRRPDAVTVSTVHKMKGLEFPAVFVVDAEANRFPRKRRGYEGRIPVQLIQDAVDRGAYQTTRDEDARLFYTALTRAERYLYVSGAVDIPGTVSRWRQSQFALRLEHAELSRQPDGLPDALVPCPRQPRMDERVMPTSYSDIRYYLRCPRDYRFRKGYGFSPAITEMFGFGQTVHSSIGRLHQESADAVPTPEQASQLAHDNFHLKHVPPSSDPLNRPGGYERGRDRAAQMAADYVRDYGGDFEHHRQVEARFEVPVEHAVISGSIDLLLRTNENDEIIEATVLDFKAMEGGPDPLDGEKLEWTELALQVQLYAKAATDVLGENARTGAVHLLKDGQRVQVPIGEDAIGAAVVNIEWAVSRIIEGDFPRRPHPDKCGACDFKLLCNQQREEFDTEARPPPLHIPERDPKMALAFSQIA
ncbi:MAG: ATP-dependent DNA helicase [Acidimicrobiaceae bacterium]|nr:ATP-dependent DNA helicase [Acidimicrobiaceae bacterium]